MVIDGKQVKNKSNSAGTSKMLCEDGQYRTPTASVAISQVQIDFGASTQVEYNKTLTIADAGITGTSNIVCSIAAVATADHSIDEILIEGVSVIAGNQVAGVGFDIMAYCASGTWGKYKVNYTIAY